MELILLSWNLLYETHGFAKHSLEKRLRGSERVAIMLCRSCVQRCNLPTTKSEMLCVQGNVGDGSSCGKSSLPPLP